MQARALALTLLLLLAGCAGGDSGGSSADGGDGADGTDGTDGTDGADGTDGGDGTDGSDGADGEDTGPTGSPGDTPLPGSCGAGVRFDGSRPAFEEATAAWGLDSISPIGVRMNAVDFDGDGWTDLVVRSGAGGNDFSTGTRAIWMLRNDGAGHFVDVTEAAGATLRRDSAVGRQAHVWVWGDVDNDGDLDAWTGTTSTDLIADNELLINQGDGSFAYSDATNAARSHPATQYGASFVDSDRDGHLDLWIASYADAAGSPAQDALYKGDGGGGFTDITAASGLRTEPWNFVGPLNEARAHTRAWSALACDLNNDQRPELLSASYGRAPNHLWQALPDGSFRNQSIAAGYAFDQRVDWSDNESARCWCTLHPDDDDCAGVPEPENIRCSSDADAFRWDHDYDREPFRLGGNSGQTVCADMDNDGWFDLLTTEIVHWDVGSSSDPSELMYNQGAADPAFRRPGNDWTGLTREHDRVDWNDGDITGSLFDFDNDCWGDVYIGSSDYPGARGLLWHQSALRYFEAVPIELGIDHVRSHGSVVADFDRDGDLDIVVGHSLARCEGDCYPTGAIRFFENKVGQDNAWLELDLVGGEGSNRAAIGARIDVTAGGVTQARQIGGGGGQWGHQDDLRVHVGLGQEASAEVTITWPDAAGSSQSFTVDTRQRYRVQQGEDPVADAAPE